MPAVDMINEYDTRRGNVVESKKTQDSNAAAKDLGVSSALRDKQATREYLEALEAQERADAAYDLSAAAAYEEKQLVRAYEQELLRQQAQDLSLAAAMEEKKLQREYELAYQKKLAAEKAMEEAVYRAQLRKAQAESLSTDKMRQEKTDVDDFTGRNELPEPLFWTRVGKTITGGIKSTVGPDIHSAGTLEEWVLNNPTLTLRVLSQGPKINPIFDFYTGKLDDYRLKAFADSTGLNRLTQPLFSAAEWLRDTGSSIRRSGVNDISIAKRGVGPVGDFFIDTGVGMTQMLGDSMMSLFGVSPIIPALVRAFGTTTDIAREKGCSLDKQMALGIATVAKEYLVEKLSGGNAVYDGGDGIIMQTVKKLTDNEQIIKLMGSVPAQKLGEALEEIVSDVLDPVIEYVITGEYEAIPFDEMLHNAVVGLTLSAISGDETQVVEKGRRWADTRWKNGRKQSDNVIVEDTLTPDEQNALNNTVDRLWNEGETEKASTIDENGLPSRDPDDINADIRDSIQGAGLGDDYEVTYGTRTKPTAKIERQMDKRGWTKESVEETVRNPYTTRKSYNKAENTPATAYYNEDGSYVVLDDIAHAVIQVSDRNAAYWEPDSAIEDPYIPKVKGGIK